MPRKRFKESDLYPRVERWMRRNLRCFKSAINAGPKYSRVDVVGVRDVGGDLSGETETIAIEVKNGREPFATASGQAAGYQVYANRVYLADRRDTNFNQDHIAIASRLGIGLIWIRDTSITEVLTSPYRTPIPRFALVLLECMALGRCRLCESVFEIGVGKHQRFSRMARENLDRAIAAEKGLMFWNMEVARRKKRLGMRMGNGESYERRFICPDCVATVIGPIREAVAGKR